MDRLRRMRPAQGYLSRLKLLTQYHVRDRLHPLRPPTLFLAADYDHLVPSVVQARFMATLDVGQRERLASSRRDSSRRMVVEWAPLDATAQGQRRGPS